MLPYAFITYFYNNHTLWWVNALVRWISLPQSHIFSSIIDSHPNYEHIKTIFYIIIYKTIKYLVLISYFIPFGKADVKDILKYVKSVESNTALSKPFITSTKTGEKYTVLLIQNKAFHYNALISEQIYQFDIIYKIIK